MESNAMQTNAEKDAVRLAFEAWAAGTGSPFDLLRDEAQWTIVGHSAAAGTYPSREAFMRDVIQPFNARMRDHLRPTVRHLYADGDTVIALFDASGIARDGKPYENTYSWYLTMRNGRITEAVAFFDSIAFDDLWKRVSPQPRPASYSEAQAEPIPVVQYEAQVKQFKPEQGLAATNRNDLRRFIYDWFTHFEHASTTDFYLSHLEDKNMSVAFPGMTTLTSHADFAKWYNNLLAQTLWNFHDVSAIQSRQTGPEEYLISFLVDWYGEVKSGSDQLGAWQSRIDSHLYRYKLRQTWTIKSGERLVIERLVVTGGDTPSPILE
jgi:ketosteroid isomerase-like protein